MPLKYSELLAELKRLARGRGLQDAYLRARIGPQIALSYEIAESTESGEARTKLIDAVKRDVGQLPADQAEVLLASLGVHPDPRLGGRFLDARVIALGEHLGVNPRTVRRLIDEAFRRLAEVAAGSPGPKLSGAKPSGAGPQAVRPAVGETPLASEGWYVSRFSALLRLDPPTPELIEQRTIVFTSPNVEEIDASVSLPRVATDTSDRHDLNVQMLYGGLLQPRDRTSDQHFDLSIRLPGTFQVGDSHEYGILFRLPPDQPMRRHYAFIPLCACERFDLRVRFAIDAPPSAIYCVDGRPPRVLDDHRPHGDQLTLDRAGELSVRFDSPRRGLAYGVRWV